MRCLCFSPIGNGIAIAGAALEALGIGGKQDSVPCSAFQDQATSLDRLARVHLAKVQTAWAYGSSTLPAMDRSWTCMACSLHSCGHTAFAVGQDESNPIGIGIITCFILILPFFINVFCLSSTPSLGISRKFATSHFASLNSLLSAFATGLSLLRRTLSSLVHGY